MIYKKMELGLLVSFIGEALSLLALMLFVPISTIFFALAVGFLLALPVSALMLILISGISMLSKKLKMPSKPEKVITY